MKRVFAVLIAGLMLTGALSASVSASGANPPVVYKTARAIPTKSGDFVRISVYAKHVRSVSIRVDQKPGPRHKAKRYGTGCGKKNCSKWRIYVPRTGNECYELGIIGSQDNGRRAIVRHTVCEPFRGGEV
ncbi:MAG: hypothetical protein JJE13_00540 [Thermoleophilia bacterium]|nr:hypothetical protein [Thermoleophilia bacterium]